MRSTCDPSITSHSGMLRFRPGIIVKSFAVRKARRADRPPVREPVVVLAMAMPPHLQPNITVTLFVEV